MITIITIIVEPRGRAFAARPRSLPKGLRGLSRASATDMIENHNFHPHPHCRAPCMKYYEGSIRPSYMYAPENMSYRGRNSGGGLGNYGTE